MKLKIKILDSHHELFKSCVSLYSDNDEYVLEGTRPQRIQSNRLNYLANELGEEGVYNKVLNMIGVILCSGAEEVILETQDEVWNWNKFLAFSGIEG